MSVSLRSQAIAWLSLWVFWTAVSCGRHPTLLVGALATGALLGACAAAVYSDRIVLAPRLLASRRFATYWAAVVLVVGAAALAAVAAIGRVYDVLWGPDERRFGFRANFGIDFAAVALHVAAAALLARRAARRRETPAPRHLQ